MMRCNLDYESAFELGRNDHLYGRPYWDGSSPPHHFLVVVPGSAFSNAAKRGYRDGWNSVKVA